DDATLSRLAADSSAMVRVHVQKVLAERLKWGSMEHDLAQVALEDRDPWVQRAAADALGRHASAANVRPLLELRDRVPKDDTHLLHGIRMALRDQLRPAEAWDRLNNAAWNDTDERALADASTGVPTIQAARFLLKHLQRAAEGFEDSRRYVGHAPRFGDAELDERLLEFIKERWKGNLSGQVVVVREMVQGLEKRGARLNDAGRAFAADMVRRQLQEPAPSPQLQVAVELAESL